MNNKKNSLAELLDRAKRVSMTREEREEQRRSFAYGNAKIENDRITRQTVDRAAEGLEVNSGAEED
jgi:hypothetical protein